MFKSYPYIIQDLNFKSAYDSYKNDLPKPYTHFVFKIFIFQILFFYK